MLWTAGILKKCLVLFKIPRSHNPLINCLNSFLVFMYYMHDFFFVVKEREGQNFDLKMSWVDFGITFFLKTKKKLKSIEDGSLVVFVFKNLIGWNTVLVIWKIHIGRIVQSLLFSLKLYRVNQKKCLIGLLFHPVISYSKCTAFWDGNNNTTEKFNFKYKILCWNVW